MDDTKVEIMNILAKCLANQILAKGVRHQADQF